jgi:hypothetical protein
MDDEQQVFDHLHGLFQDPIPPFPPARGDVRSKLDREMFLYTAVISSAFQGEPDSCELQQGGQGDHAVLVYRPSGAEVWAYVCIPEGKRLEWGELEDGMGPGGTGAAFLTPMLYICAARDGSAWLCRSDIEGGSGFKVSAFGTIPLTYLGNEEIIANVKEKERIKASAMSRYIFLFFFFFFFFLFI